MDKQFWEHSFGMSDMSRQLEQQEIAFIPRQMQMGWDGVGSGKVVHVKAQNHRKQRLLPAQRATHSTRWGRRKER